MSLNKTLLCTLVLLLFTNPAFTEPSALVLYKRGRQEQLKENYYHAIELYKQALGVNQSFLEPMIGLSECFNHLGQYDEALHYIIQARKHDRHNLGLINLEASIRTGLGEVEAARELYRSVLTTEPHNLEARFGLAGLDLADGKKRLASLQYLETLKTSPGNKRALLILALLYEEGLSEV